MPTTSNDTEQANVLLVPRILEGENIDGMRVRPKWVKKGEALEIIAAHFSVCPDTLRRVGIHKRLKSSHLGSPIRGRTRNLVARLIKLSDVEELIAQIDEEMTRFADYPL